METLVECKEVSVGWVSLKKPKQSNPVEMSKNTAVNEISDEPGLIYWNKETLRS